MGVGEGCRGKGESNGVGRCSVVGDKQEKFEERERRLLGAQKDNEECNVHRNRIQRFFFFLIF